jgi:hypothetical protein
MPNGQLQPLPIRSHPHGVLTPPAAPPLKIPLNAIAVAQPATTTSTGAKVATGAAVAVGGVSLTLIAVSAATGWGVTKVLEKALDWVKGKK